MYVCMCHRRYYRQARYYILEHVDDALNFDSFVPPYHTLLITEYTQFCHVESTVPALEPSQLFEVEVSMCKVRKDGVTPQALLPRVLPIDHLHIWQCETWEDLR